MLKLLADENFNNAILRGIRHREPTADIARVQDIGLQGAGDPDVLAQAAREGRVLLTHDLKTVPRHALELIEAGTSIIRLLDPAERAASFAIEARE